jgi:hypothetical protein
MRQLIFLIPVLLLLSCGESTTEKDSSSNGKTDSTSTESELATTKELSEINYEIDIDEKTTPFKGEITASAEWNDARGKNRMIISQIPQYYWEEEKPEMKKLSKDPEGEPQVTEIFAYHYIWSDEENKWKSFWYIHDFLFGCCDVYIDLQKESFQILDEDKNGEAETVFFYTHGQGTARIDGYQEAKLMYHPDATKLKVEGTTGAGKAMIETPEYNIDPVPIKFVGFTGKYEKYKANAEKFWNECHERQIKIDQEFLSVFGKGE